MPTSGNFYQWQLSKRGNSVQVKLDGPLVFNSLGPILDAALAGLGIANVPFDLADEHIAAGRLARVMADWSENLPALSSILSKQTTFLGSIPASGRRDALAGVAKIVGSVV